MRDIFEKSLKVIEEYLETVPKEDIERKLNRCKSLDFNGPKLKEFEEYVKDREEETNEPL